MRICVFASDIDIAAPEKDALLSALNVTFDTGTVTAIHAITYRWPRSDADVSHLHFFSGHDKLRLRLCLRLLRLIDETAWIPTFLAMIPLALCYKEIREMLLAADPDVIAFSGVRWGGFLARLFRAHYPHWIFLTRQHEPMPRTRHQRTVDRSPLVSIILPTYNGSRYLRQSVESCLRQTYANLELIVVDDGSTEDIGALLEPNADSRLHYIRHERNSGLPHALNTGFRRSVGQYLTWTSDDNYFAPHAIERMLGFLQRYPEVDFVYAESYILDETNGDAPPRLQRNEPPDYLSVRNAIGACYLYRRKVYETIGDFDTRFFLAEDYDYWIRVARRFRMQRLFEPLYYYRLHSGSLTCRSTREAITEVTTRMKRQRNISVA